MRSADPIHSFVTGYAKTQCNLVRAIVSSILVGLLAGCAAGPDFKRPTPPDVSSYTTTPLPVQTVETCSLRRFGPCGS